MRRDTKQMRGADEEADEERARLQSTLDYLGSGNNPKKHSAFGSSSAHLDSSSLERSVPPSLRNTWCSRIRFAVSWNRPAGQRPMTWSSSTLYAVERVSIMSTDLSPDLQVRWSASKCLSTSAPQFLRILRILRFLRFDYM